MKNPIRFKMQRGCLKSQNLLKNIFSTATGENGVDSVRKGIY